MTRLSRSILPINRDRSIFAIGKCRASPGDEEMSDSDLKVQSERISLKYSLFLAMIVFILLIGITVCFTFRNTLLMILMFSVPGESQNLEDFVIFRIT